MQDANRRQENRRGAVRGYGPERRRKGEGINLGLDSRRKQRRFRDRRQAVRRSDDMSYESSSHI